jgi:hypothetical protein
MIYFRESVKEDGDKASWSGGKKWLAKVSIISNTGNH